MIDTPIDKLCPVFCCSCDDIDRMIVLAIVGDATNGRVEYQSVVVGME